MKSIPSRLALVSLLAALGSTAALATTAADADRPAAAQAQLVDASQPEQILNIARGFGSAELRVDGLGDPLIVGRIDGRGYHIAFYGCTEGQGCSNIQFMTAWKGPQITPAQINDWNRTRRFGKACLDDQGEPRLDMSVNLAHGVSRDNLEDSFGYWQGVMKQFAQAVLGE